MHNLLMIIGALLLIMGLPASVITTVILAVKKNKKVVIPAVCIPATFVLSMILIGIGGYMYGQTDEYKEIAEQKRIEEQEKKEEEKEQKKEENTEKELNKEEILIEDGMERIDSGEYLFVTNEDLDKYCPNMEGINIYTVIEIDDMKDGMIQSNLSGGYMMSNFYVGDNYEQYKSKLSKGDIIAISGTVSGSDGYGLFGKSVKIEDCLVFSFGDKAKQYEKESSDERLYQYFVATEEVANSGGDISEEEYKELCETLDYEDVLRNPKNSNGKYCKVEGKVDQIIEGWFGAFTIYVTDYNGNKWGCIYSYKEGESRLLEGDSVVMYGKCEGTDTVETLLGKQVTLPKVDVEYIN